MFPFFLISEKFSEFSVVFSFSLISFFFLLTSISPFFLSSVAWLTGLSGLCVSLPVKAWTVESASPNTQCDLCVFVTKRLSGPRPFSFLPFVCLYVHFSIHLSVSPSVRLAGCVCARVFKDRRVSKRPAQKVMWQVTSQRRHWPPHKRSIYRCQDPTPHPVLITTWRWQPLSLTSLSIFVSHQHTGPPFFCLPWTHPNPYPPRPVAADSSCFSAVSSTTSPRSQQQ